MGLRIAEVGIHPVAHKLGYVTVITGDDTGTGVLIGAEQFTHILRIEFGRQCCRADEVAEQDGELAAFGFDRLRSEFPRW